MRRGVTVASVCAAALALGVTAVALRSAAADRAAARETLPEGARDILRPWMAAHRTDVDQLVSAVLMLHYDKAAEVATNMANDPHLARPTPESWDSINNAIPKKFFDLQDAYRAAAKKVASSARMRDSNGLARDFGGLMQSCVRCHASYLGERK
jgi:cytochrome c556